MSNTLFEPAQPKEPFAGFMAPGPKRTDCPLSELDVETHRLSVIEKDKGFAAAVSAAVILRICNFCLFTVCFAFRGADFFYVFDVC